MEPSILFHELIKHVYAENITNERIRTLVLPLIIINVTSKLESQNLFSQKYDSNLDFMMTQTQEPNNKITPHFRK